MEKWLDKIAATIMSRLSFLVALKQKQSPWDQPVKEVLAESLSNSKAVSMGRWLDKIAATVDV